MEVLVYKTNINHRTDIEKISPVLSQYNKVLAWNVDIDDIDKVLRIEAMTNISNEIQNIINQSGYTCQEME